MKLKPECKTDKWGDKEWKTENGALHRSDGPAVEKFNGTKMWYKDGKLHREDGPAFVSKDGNKHWFLNGIRHREDGPAVEFEDGTKFWVLDGKELTLKQFNQIKMDKNYKGEILKVFK